MLLSMPWAAVASAKNCREIQAQIVSWVSALASERTAVPTYLVSAQDRADSPFNLLADHQQVWRDLGELDDAMREAGVIIFSRGLQPADAAVTFRAEPGGEIVASPGPYGESTLSGMWIIECPEADAEGWSARCAAAHRCDVELRPFQPDVSEYLEE